MQIDDLSLPDDMDLLKAMVRAIAQKTSVLEEENAALKARSLDVEERITRLMQILKAYDRARFGRRSEKQDSAGTGADEEAQKAFVFEEIETGIAALKAQTGQGRASGEKRAPRPRKGFPPHLERVEVVIEPEDLAEYAGKQKVLIGEGVSERLDVMSMNFQEVTSYIMQPDLVYPTNLEVFVNMDRWNALGADHKRVVEDAVRATTGIYTSKILHQDVTGVSSFVNDHGGALVMMEDSVLEQIRTAAMAVVDEISAQDPRYSARLGTMLHEFMRFTGKL